VTGLKLSKAEIASFAVAAAFIVLAGGFLIGRSGRSADFSITVERSAEETELLTGRDGTAGESILAAEAGGLMDINSASAEELASLPGIGEVLAGRIVEYREENGDFESIDGIMSVYGIGDSIYEGIYDKICVNP